MSTSRKFGEIAVMRDWLRVDDVNAALSAQQELQRLGLPERIGEILRKRGLLANEQVREILLEQGAGPLRDLVPGYEILERLGQGGMGAVYRARRRADGSEVALKLLPPRLGRDPDFVARFIREARATNELRHPNIVAGIDAGCADDHYFVAMELVEGESLDERLRREGTLPEPDVLAVGLAVARALAYAHERGLVHRDVKPGNILLGGTGDGGSGVGIHADGSVKLCDLGLAKWVDVPGTAVTQTGLGMGTPQYVAPEQAVGAADVDIRADLYSLGATLYHAITGRAPFVGGSAADIAARRLFEDVPPARSVRPSVSPALNRLLKRLLQRAPSDRPDGPAEVVAALERLASGEHLVEEARASRQLVWWGATAALAGFVVFGGITWAFGRNGETPATGTPAAHERSSGHRDAISDALGGMISLPPGAEPVPEDERSPVELLLDEIADLRIRFARPRDVAAQLEREVAAAGGPESLSEEERTAVEEFLEIVRRIDRRLAEIEAQAARLADAPATPDDG